KFLPGVVGLWRESVVHSFARLHKLTVGFESTPLLIGIGYLIGFRIAAVMLAGSLMGHWCLIPLIDWFGRGVAVAVPPADDLIGNMDGLALRSAYVKYIGAGGVAFGGALGIVRLFPQIWRQMVRVLLRRGESVAIRASQEVRT